jgi:hypothetical protein
MAYFVYFDAPNPGEVGVDPGGRIVGGVSVYASGNTDAVSASVITRFQDNDGNDFQLGPYQLDLVSANLWDDANDRVGAPLDFDFRLEATVEFGAHKRGHSGATIVTSSGPYTPVQMNREAPHPVPKSKQPKKVK